MNTVSPNPGASSLALTRLNTRTQRLGRELRVVGFRLGGSDQSYWEEKRQTNTSSFYAKIQSLEVLDFRLSDILRESLRHPDAYKLIHV